MALFLTSLSLRNIALCTCAPSSVSILLQFLHLACFPDLTTVRCWAEILGVPMSLKFFIFSGFMPKSGTAEEKAVAPHSSTLAWKIPWTEEPGGLQSMGSLRVGHDWATSLSLFTFMHWRRKWQPTPVFLPGESRGRGSLVGCCLWGRTESDMTEVT